MGEHTIDVKPVDGANSSPPASDSPSKDAPKKSKDDEEALDKAKLANFWVGISTLYIYTLSARALLIPKRKSEDPVIQHHVRLVFDGCSHYLLSRSWRGTKCCSL